MMTSEFVCTNVLWPHSAAQLNVHTFSICHLSLMVWGLCWHIPTCERFSAIKSEPPHTVLTINSSMYNLMKLFTYWLHQPLDWTQLNAPEGVVFTDLLSVRFTSIGSKSGNPRCSNEILLRWIPQYWATADYYTDYIEPVIWVEWSWNGEVHIPIILSWPLAYLQQTHTQPCIHIHTASRGSHEHTVHKGNVQLQQEKNEEVGKQFQKTMAGRWERHVLWSCTPRNKPEDWVCRAERRQENKIIHCYSAALWKSISIPQVQRASHCCQSCCAREKIISNLKIKKMNKNEFSRPHTVQQWPSPMWDTIDKYYKYQLVNQEIDHSHFDLSHICLFICIIIC